MANFFETKLTEREVLKLNRLLERKTRPDGHCILWTGQQKFGYGILEFRFRRQKVKLRVHRVRMYIHTSCTHMGDNHVSHLCHNKLCINIEHLSCEPASINNRRQVCRNNGECTGHYGYPRCIGI